MPTVVLRPAGDTNVFSALQIHFQSDLQDYSITVLSCPPEDGHVMGIHTSAHQLSEQYYVPHPAPVYIFDHIVECNRYLSLNMYRMYRKGRTSGVKMERGTSMQKKPRLTQCVANLRMPK